MFPHYNLSPQWRCVSDIGLWDLAAQAKKLPTCVYFHACTSYISRVLWPLLIPATWLHHHLLRGVVSVRLQILLVGTCRLRTIVSVTGHIHREVIGQDPFVQICKHGPWPVWKRLSRDHVSRDVVFVSTSRSWDRLETYFCNVSVSSRSREIIGRSRSWSRLTC